MIALVHSGLVVISTNRKINKKGRKQKDILITIHPILRFDYLYICLDNNTCNIIEKLYINLLFALA